MNADHAPAQELRPVYPLEWHDEHGEWHNTWSRRSFTGEIEPDPDGEPLYTTRADMNRGPVCVDCGLPPGRWDRFNTHGRCGRCAFHAACRELRDALLEPLFPVVKWLAARMKP